MKRQGELREWSLPALLRFVGKAMRNPYIITGLPLMALSFFALMALLSTTPLSFAVPVTASSYILETGLAKYVLKEKVDWHRWAGTLLVAVGITFLAL
jgi:drug/metabolite transporter (DMT)-like permease